MLEILAYLENLEHSRSDANDFIQAGEGSAGADELGEALLLPEDGCPLPDDIYLLQAFSAFTFLLTRRAPRAKALMACMTKG